MKIEKMKMNVETKKAIEIKCHQTASIGNEIRILIYSESSSPSKKMVTSLFLHYFPSSCIICSRMNIFSFM